MVTDRMNGAAFGGTRPMETGFGQGAAGRRYLFSHPQTSARLAGLWLASSEPCAASGARIGPTQGRSKDRHHTLSSARPTRLNTLG